jgi:23S rRNA pseudouridine2605 synthase
MSQPEKLTRIAKYISECGFASRRKAEELVLMGKVRVNGTQISNVATKVGESDKVEVFGKPLHRPREIKIWLFHKPKGTLTTSMDPQGRRTIYDVLPSRFKNIITVGRLDFNTEGLLILTNNGDFSRKMELPSSGINREYRVRLLGDISIEDISRIESGITIDGIYYQPCQITIEGDHKDARKNFWLRIRLTEGKNREIRNIFEHFGLRISRLIRISFGPFYLEGIKPGDVVEVPKAVTDTLLDEIFKV